MESSTYDDRAKVFLGLHYSAVDKMADLVIQLEKYFIVCPQLEIFSVAFGSALHEQQCKFEELFEFMTQHYPVDADDGNSVNFVETFNEKLLQEQKELCFAYADAGLDVNTYLSDLGRELQTLLLGDLFPGNKVARRLPIDPSLKVISLEPDSVARLRDHFLNETSWGKEQAKTKAEVHKHFYGSAR